MFKHLPPTNCPLDCVRIASMWKLSFKYRTGNAVPLFGATNDSTLDLNVPNYELCNVELVKTSDSVCTDWLW